MLIFRILGTVLVGISCITSFLKNCLIFKEFDDTRLVRNVSGWTLYSWLWRAFIIVALWVIH